MNQYQKAQLEMLLGADFVECSQCKRKLYEGDFREYKKGKPVCHQCLFPLFKGNRNGKAKQNVH